MTKSVRIENADTSSHPVRVTVQDIGADGQWVDTLSKQIDSPTQMLQEYIHSSRRIVIEERPADPPKV